MEYDLELLKKKSQKYRKAIIELIYRAKAGHPGGSLSCIDILNYLYTYKIDFNNENRSRLVLSKGHVTPAIYAVFMDLGFINDDEIDTFRRVNSRLQGHPDRNKIPELDANTGLLGQGLSIGIGMALGKKLKKDNSKVYVIIGDGEMQEGQIWEGLMSGAHYNLNNLTVFLDYNKLSSKNDVNKTMNLEPIKDKIEAFGWNLIEINGHEFNEIKKSIEFSEKSEDKPTFIIAHTVKGKGVSFMENNPKWHSSALTQEEYDVAIEDIERGN
ncbi:transketolase [Pseudoleptotrichia goodfellowii]|uniref:Transketolase n=1 Tax=Pseudoleptotrichia goodfellowii TaxID=157692 RepID=A0A510J8G2_9FUSO|nr:transketolase [Pseudoleptotrichia goodfellowii]BBM35346.1 transketolase [Pseudoleptotrichia goodfellowii]